MSMESVKIRVERNTEIDLVKCPHILIGGSTGSGKSYLMKSMLCDILERKENRCKVIIIDPKSVDYQFLNSPIRRLTDEDMDQRMRFEGDTGSVEKVVGRGRKERKVICDEKSGGRYADWYWGFKGLGIVDRNGIEFGRALNKIEELECEMGRRYELMKYFGFEEWGRFVEWADSVLKEDEYEGWNGICQSSECEELRTKFREVYGTEVEGRGDHFDRLVLIVDELTDLIYWDRDKSRGVFRGRVESGLVRLSMLGRAAGIHLILGTQRPDAQTLSGQLRANIACRICLRVQSVMERRIVLGQSGNGSEREMVYQSELVSLERALR